MTGARRILVTGSRDWTDRAVIGRALADVCIELFGAPREWAYLGQGAPPDVTVVHGAARGADSIAGEWAALRGLAVEEHPYARWLSYGRKRAGYVRNQAMVDAGADVCLAFILNGSRGATMCAEFAEKAGIPVRRFELRSPQ